MTDTYNLSLWGSAPSLIERLAASATDPALQKEAQDWLQKAKDTPRYDYRVESILDSEVQRLATLALRAGENEVVHEDMAARAMTVRKVLQDVIAGNWPQPPQS